MRQAISAAAALFVLLAASGAVTQEALRPQAPLAGSAEGARLWEERCATCHDYPTDRIPPKLYLQVIKTPEQVVQALTTGIMQANAAGLTPAQIAALAVHVTGRPPGLVRDPDPAANPCRGTPPAPRLDGAQWNGWGRDLANTRHQPRPGFKPSDIPRLKLKWAFAYPGNAVDAHPALLGDRMFAAARAGRVFALDAATGCTWWSYDAGAQVRSTLSVGLLPSGRHGVFFSAENGTVHGLDADTGAVLWSLRVEDHPVVRQTGAVILHRNRLYVPFASLEEVSNRDPRYPCCNFRGSVAAIDVVTGKLLWKSYTIAQEPKPYAANEAGTTLYGPAGAAVFAAGTVDEKRGLLYVGTGNSYTQISHPHANALLALDLDTGAIRWSRQVLAQDNVCPFEDRAKCETRGPDLDFASPVVLKRVNGKDLLIAGTKAGIVFAFDPDREGKILWQTIVGPESSVGGPWGTAVDDRHAYIGTVDAKTGTVGQPIGVTAVELTSGRIAWHVEAPEARCTWEPEKAAVDMNARFGAPACSRSVPAALTVVPGAVFAGSLDGHLRAYATQDGALLWEFDTGRAFPAVNGGEARGGSISYSALSVAGGLLMVNSGAAGLHRQGNALLVFSVDGK